MIRRCSKTTNKLWNLRGMVLVKPIGSSLDQDAAFCRFMVPFLVAQTCFLMDLLGPLVADWQTFPSRLRSSICSRLCVLSGC